MTARCTLTVGGLPGTGTTTVCRSLSELSGLTYVYAGRIFRDMADEKGMTLEEFGAHAEAHAAVDLELDARQVELLKGGPVILEGRLSGYWAYRDRVPAFKTWFTADAHERARRLVAREGGDIDQRLAEMRRREASERKRYLEYYDFDLHDLGVYDLVLDTTQLSPSEVASAVDQAWQRASKRAGRKQAVS